MPDPLTVIAQLLLVVVVGLLISCIHYGLEYSFKKRDIEQPRRKKLLTYIAIAISCWLAFLAGLSLIGFFTKFDAIPPRFLLAIIPPFVLVVYLTYSKSFGNILRVLPPAWLIYVQSFRIIVELILWLCYKIGLIPFQMTFEGFNYDIIVGITALMAGYVFFLRGRYRRLEIFIWNIFGIALLLNIVTIAILSTPTPFRVFMNEPPNTLVFYFPFIWLPGFIVPFALAMHLFSIRQLFLLKDIPQYIGFMKKT